MSHVIEVDSKPEWSILCVTFTISGIAPRHIQSPVQWILSVLSEQVKVTIE